MSQNAPAVNTLNTTDTPIRWGIIGAGHIARTFATDIDYAAHASLNAVASRELSKAQTFAEDFSIPTAYGSYDEILADPNIDAIYIATPHTHHKDQSIAALCAGKHVLCEKPATVTPAELEEVIAVAMQEQRYFMEGMWTYFMPVIQKAREWVDSGRIGNLCHVKADFGFPMPYDPDSRVYSNRLGGGCLLDMGIYPIAMAWLFLKQDPESQTVWHHKAENGVEDDVVILNTYVNSQSDSEATAQLTTSFRSKLNNYLTLIGDRGTLTIADYWAAREVKLYQGAECIDRFCEERPQCGFNHQIEQVSCDLLAGKLQSEVVSWNHSRAFQRQMAAIKKQF
jgi:predicted dehydrogenase